MIFVCRKETEREVLILKACELRAKNKNLQECYGCEGPISQSEAVVMSIAKKEQTKNIPLLRSRIELPKIWGG